MSLQPHVFSNPEDLSRYGADWLVGRLRERPDALVCLASGATPVRTYQLLAESGLRQPSLFNQCRILKLDEWGGLPPSDPATCDQHLRTVLINPLNLGARYVAFESDPKDARAECGRISAWLEQNGPIDICVLGLGVNGHLGFNEPAESLQPHAQVAELTDESRAHAMIARRAERPTYGLTLGMADLMQARQVLLLVTGAAKRDALQRLINGPVTTQFPASLLQLHSNVKLLCDAAACP